MIHANTQQISLEMKLKHHERPDLSVFVPQEFK